MIKTGLSVYVQSNVTRTLLVSLYQILHLHQRFHTNSFSEIFSAASNIPGKLLTGWISDQNWVDVFSLYNAYIILCGITMFFFPFCNSYGLYGFIVALYGFFTTFFILKTIILVEIVGIENLTSAFSLLNLFEGIAALIGPTICGLIFDFAGSYDKSFYVAGGFFLVAGLFSQLAKLLHRKKVNEKQKIEKII